MKPPAAAGQSGLMGAANADGRREQGGRAPPPGRLPAPVRRGRRGTRAMITQSREGVAGAVPFRQTLPLQSELLD
ncbi:hypothetical protein [Streptomyces sp. NPDC059597]|uniref:hypothetical protein n=1 Tax=Streptomyces sp. NPDC059597 TaxID=3346879 RepID=UPI0036C80121